MCNRARFDGEPETLREKFGARWGPQIPNRMPIELYPKSAAPVIRSAETQHIVDMMRWGVLGDEKAVKGIGTNVRQLQKWKWLTQDPAKRCLIPLTEFCEWTPAPIDLGDGKKPVRGEMWFQVTDQPMFAVAGFYQRLGDQDHFAMVTCDPNEKVAPIHSKAMITILQPEDWDRWLHGSYDDLVALQKPYPAGRMTVRGPVFPTRAPKERSPL